jgi:hypothetical protein
MKFKDFFVASYTEVCLDYSSETAVAMSSKLKGNYQYHV